jgi:hypothetical protein
MWSLDATDRAPQDLDGQLAEVLSRLTPSTNVWRISSGRYEIDLYCGFFMQETNEGLEVSAESLAALGQRGIALGMDIYSPIREDLKDDESPS